MKHDIQPLTPGQRDIMAKLEENTPQLTEADIGAAIRLAAVNKGTNTSDPLGITSALVDDLRVQIAALQDTLDLNNDEFARIWAMSANASEVRQLCDRARRRTKQTVSLIAQLEQAEADVRMWKGNYEAAEQHVTILTKQLAENEAKWKATFEKRVAREEELLNDTIQETVNDVLAKLNANGVDTTDCDGDEDVVTILAHWIQAGIETKEEAETARVQTTVWAADALNCRQAIRSLMAHFAESEKDGWTPAQRHAMHHAQRCLLAGGGGAEQAGDDAATQHSGANSGNDKLSNDAP